MLKKLASILIVSAILASCYSGDCKSDDVLVTPHTSCKKDGERCDNGSECCPWLYCMYDGVCYPD